MPRAWADILVLCSAKRERISVAVFGNTGVLTRGKKKKRTSAKRDRSGHVMTRIPPPRRKWKMETGDTVVSRRPRLVLVG
jgi:hypothetical protein